MKHEGQTSHPDLLLPVAMHFQHSNFSHGFYMGYNSPKGKIIGGTVFHHVYMMLVKWKSISIHSTRNDSQSHRYNLAVSINKT